MEISTRTPLITPEADLGVEFDADLQRRFIGVERLYGAAALARFKAARICVIGVGGVGSWVVEALARSAIGQITMIDLDNLSESNINRQIHALSDTLGIAKVSALASRIAQINPACNVIEIEDFITPDNVAQMLNGTYDYVIDAIDQVASKVALIVYCRAHSVRLLTIGSAGGQLDPTRIGVRDLSKTEQEPLLAKVRRRLRTEYGFPRGNKNSFGIDAVFSTEPLRQPWTGASCALPDDSAMDAVTGLNCAGFGSSVMVTASFGLIAAAHVLQQLAQPAPALLTEATTLETSNS